MSAGTPASKKDVMVLAYWKADGKHIWDQGGLLLEPWILSEASTQQHHVPPVGKKPGEQGYCHTQEQNGGFVVGKSKKLMEMG